MSFIEVCPESLNAIQGAIGAVCEAVDKVVLSGGIEGQTTSPTELPAQRAFVAIRPPGHHCGEDTPSGFCFVNNVAIGAVHGMDYLPYRTYDTAEQFGSSSTARCQPHRHPGY